MIEFTPRKIQSSFWTILSPIISITVTILIGSLIFKILSYPVIESLYQVFVSPFSRPDRIADIFVKACPLIIIGLGLIFCFKAIFGTSEQRVNLFSELYAQDHLHYYFLRQKLTLY